jgi:hypothetical protein
MFGQADESRIIPTKFSCQKGETADRFTTTSRFYLAENQQ